MPNESPQIVPTKPTFGTRQGNGTALLPGVDGRCTMARRYRELVTAMESDLGGDLPMAKQAIVLRAATLIAWAEQAEGHFAKTGEMDVQQFTTAVNALRRLLADIGLERVARDVPSLNEWIQKREQTA